MKNKEIKKILVAYSGGLDTSVILKWLKEEYNSEVIAYCADVGQQEELEGLEEKALTTGASKCIIDDIKEEFAKDYIFPMIASGAIYEGEYLLGTSIARPCISKKMVDFAIKNSVDAIAHGATGKGNDQVRFELSIASLSSDIEIIAPWRQKKFREQFPGRSEMIEYARENNIPIQASSQKPYSMDRNLLHISFESGILEDPWYDASGKSDEDMYVMSLSPEKAQDSPQYVQLLFDKGNCIGLCLDGLSEIIEQLKDVKSIGSKDDYTLLNPYGIMRVLNLLGYNHGIGRVDMVENRFVGMKSRGIYETPGGTILFKSHRQLESLTMDRELMHLRDSLIPKYSEMVYNGFWFSPERKSLQAFIDQSQKTVSGEVKIKLYKGNIISAGRRSRQFSLYDEDIASMEKTKEDTYNQDDATGFIKLNSIRLRKNSQINNKINNQ